MGKDTGRKKETKYGARLKRRKALARKTGGGFFIVPSGCNSGKRMPKPMSVLLQLARDKGIVASYE